MTEREFRQRFVLHLTSYEGCLYRWAGTFPREDRRGDCSGLGCRACWELGVVPRSLRITSRYIHSKWEPTDDPQPGDAVTYATLLPGSALLGKWAWPFVTHVEWITASSTIYIDPETKVGTRVWPVIGASGGGRLTRTREQARAKGAKVKRHARHDWRVHVAGFRRLPITDELLESFS